MADLTTLQRVEALWQPVPSALIPRANALIAKASRMLRHAYGDIDARILAGTLDAELVSDVADAMVVRVLQNFEGFKAVTVDDIRAERDASLTSGAMFIAPEELDLLAPANTSTELGTMVPRWPGC